MHSYPVGAFHPIEDTSVNHSIGSRSSSFKQPIKTWGISFLRYALSFWSSRIGSLVSNSMNEGVFADESVLKESLSVPFRSCFQSVEPAGSSANDNWLIRDENERVEAGCPPLYR